MSIIDKFLQDRSMQIVVVTRDGEDEIICPGDEWMDLRRTPCGYTYAHEKRECVVALLVRNSSDGRTILGRFEEVPPHKDGLKLVSLSGTIEEGECPEAAVIREIAEEAGYHIKPEALLPLGHVFPSKGGSIKVYLYAVDVGNVPQGVAKGDGTVHEEMAYTDWVAVEDVLHSTDPVLVTLAARYLGIYRG